MGLSSFLILSILMTQCEFSEHSSPNIFFQIVHPDEVFAAKLLLLIFIQGYFFNHTNPLVAWRVIIFPFYFKEHLDIGIQKLSLFVESIYFCPTEHFLQ